MNTPDQNTRPHTDSGERAADAPDLWEQFMQDRVYNKGVSEETVRYYRWVHRAMEPCLAAPTKAALMARKAALLADGISAISVNTYLRGYKS